MQKMRHRPQKEFYMSNYTMEQRLEGTRIALLMNSIFFCIGWVILMIGFLNLNMAHGLWDAMILRALLGTTLGELFFRLGWGIIGLPKILAMLSSGIGSALFAPLKADYEIVTYQNGMKIGSNGGAESMMTNFFVKLIQIGIIYIIGGFFTIIHLIFLSFKYLILHLRASRKPAFIKSGLFIIVINIIVLIGGFVIGAVIQKSADAIDRSSRGEMTTSGFQYIKNETGDGVVIEDYLGSQGGAIVIPSVFDDLPVVGIGGRLAFSELGRPPYGAKDNRRERITSVEIPDTVVFIERAFRSCSELSLITLPINLKFIRSAAFESSGLTSIVIPEGVTDIGEGAFAGCTNLTSVTLPRSLKRIGSRVFSECASLVDVIIPSGHTIIYGRYQSGQTDHYIEGSSVIEGMGTYNYFVPTQQNVYDGSFYECSSLSAASRQAIRASGYTGEF
jgi:hypothetical protein